ncbi:MAG: mannosyl-3-phosphoglycerate phosphatase [Thermodesulfobacteriota bacterium]
MMITPKPIIFTDLDGTLLDQETYSFKQASPALEVIQQKGIPLILSSSKTRAEIEVYRKELSNDHPFISENGGAIFIPQEYFSFEFHFDREFDRYMIIELGTFYLQIIEVLKSIMKETGIKIVGFSNLTEEELTNLCGFSLEEANLAKKREYDEAFMVEGGEKEIERVKGEIKKRGMGYTWGGRFHHIFGKNDKGKAVEILRDLYERQFFTITTVGIGNSINDLPMLFAVDHPIFLKIGKAPLPDILSYKKNVKVIHGIGPKAWNLAILDVIKDLNL